MYIWNLGMKKGMKSRTKCVETRTDETCCFSGKINVPKLVWDNK